MVTHIVDGSEIPPNWLGAVPVHQVPEDHLGPDVGVTSPQPLVVLLLVVLILVVLLLVVLLLLVLCIPSGGILKPLLVRVGERQLGSRDGELEALFVVGPFDKTEDLLAVVEREERVDKKQRAEETHYRGGLRAGAGHEEIQAGKGRWCGGKEKERKRGGTRGDRDLGREFQRYLKALFPERESGRLRNRSLGSQGPLRPGERVSADEKQETTARTVFDDRGLLNVTHFGTKRTFASRRWTAAGGQGAGLVSSVVSGHLLSPVNHCV